MRKEAFVFSCAAGLVASAASALFGAAITPGNLVIYRVGDGSATLNANATGVWLDEYTTTGSLVQSISIPSSGATGLTATGNSTTEGIISPSQDGNKLVFTGYRHAAGSAIVAADVRLIGSVMLDGTVDTSIGVTDLGSNAIRSATTVDGSNYYVSTAAAVRYVGTPGASSTSVSIDNRNSRQVQLFSNQLLASNGSTAITGKVQSYGTLPTSTTPATPVVVLASGDAVNGFVPLDLNPAVPGLDTIYDLSTVNSQLQKWVFNGSTWTAAGTVSSGTTQDLTAVVQPNGDVDLYVTSPSALQKITDTSGATGSISGSLANLVSAGTNTAFRGIGILTPEPGTLAALSVLSLVMARRRRR